MLFRSVLATNVLFPPTFNEATWSEVSVTVSLPAGPVRIRLESTTTNGLSNIDWLKAGGMNPQGVSLPRVRARLNAAGQGAKGLMISGLGSIHQAYVVETSTNLASWRPLLTNYSNSSGALSLTTSYPALKPTLQVFRAREQ